MKIKRRLTQQDADDIKSMYLNSSQNMSQLARMFKTSPTTVSKIIDGNWKPFVPKPKKKRTVSRGKPDED